MTALQEGVSAPDRMLEAAHRASEAVPPLWPLAASVAVNPYLGQSRENLATAAARLERVSGARVTLERAWYKEQIDAGEITDTDLQAALLGAPADLRPSDLSSLKSALTEPYSPPRALPTVAQLAALDSGIDWPSLIVERIGVWAAAYFDEGQALWPAPNEAGAWQGWRDFAMRDLSPEIAGLKGFAARISSSPLTASASLRHAATRLRLSPAAMETYFHELFMTLGGWAQIARHKTWQANFTGKLDNDLLDLLAIRLQWEVALLEQYEETIGDGWDDVIKAHARPIAADRKHVIDMVLQEAFERAAQRDFLAMLEKKLRTSRDSAPRLHAVFCIDVRSEIYRRALESVDAGISTAGVAGFFGLALKHKGFSSDTIEARCPVLVKPTIRTGTELKGITLQEKATRARITARAKRAWGRFKLAAVSSFAFVEAAGLLYVLRLIRDALGLASPIPGSEAAPGFEPLLPLMERVDLAEAALRAMSLTHGFARLVIFAGHGAHVVNNPHASMLQCGACGGYSGETNARVLASLLNDPEVRKGLTDRGINIPDDTLFLGALHDTTTDRMRLYEGDTDTNTHRANITQAVAWFEKAGKIARAERALRLPHAERPEQIEKRSRDWAEIRPEWALAGCHAFIAAPRAQTTGKNLSGRAFLHDYDWREDKDFGTLEMILTAPVIVASWINLQYFGSTVAPETFGAGNKLLHNVTGGMGVFEGNNGILRSGLPWQSIHDGEKFVHKPLRLSVFVKAPTDAINGILRRHESVRALFENRWLHLFAIGDRSNAAHRYVTAGSWESVKD